MSSEKPGVSFVVPVHNGERHLEAVLSAVLAQDDGRPMEVIAVDDRSTDGSAAILARFAAEHGVRVIGGAGRGAAAALNLGVREARHPLIAQVDQDVVVASGWLVALAAALADPTVAAAQGRYRAAAGASLWARVMSLDLAQRYDRLGRRVDHVCTGNTLFRAAALRQVGSFDESLGYGYDNDLSYRLGEAGYRLVLCHEAVAVHAWSEGMRGYLRQQYGQGYGRLDLVARHRRRFSGDDVSGPAMMLHAPAMLLAAAALVAAPVLAVAGGPWRPAALGAATVAGLLFVERLAAGARAFASSRDRAALAFAPVHLLRDLAWVAAIFVWGLRRLLRRPPRPRYSMPRDPIGRTAGDPAPTFHSRFGGLWTDRTDGERLLRDRLESGVASDDQAELLEHWIDHGYVILEKAVPGELVDEVNADVERAWRGELPGIWTEHWTGHETHVTPVRPELRERPHKLLDLYARSAAARRAIFSPPILELLSLVFERPPMAFQSLSLLRGTGQPMHQDTAYVVVSSPLELAASWIALEDIAADAGALEYYDGSHRLEEYLFGGVSKHMAEGDPDHQRYLDSLHDKARRLGLERQTFLARKGDALIWSADLVHGGSSGIAPGSTRRSLVTHYCPSELAPGYFADCRHSGRRRHGPAACYCYVLRG